jgi:hypothetical protein
VKDGRLAYRMHGARRLVIVASVLKLLGLEQDNA